MSEHDSVHNLRGDAVLLARLRDGDEVAFDTLVRAYGGSLIRQAAWIIGSADYAQDVVQEVFLHLWRERSRVETSWDIAAYLYGLTRNRAINFARSEQTTSQREQRWTTQLHVETGDASRIDDSVTEAAQVRTEVWDALAGVSPRCREVFMLVWDHHLPYIEIAHQLGLAEPTVRSHVSRALKRLADVLGPKYRSGEAP